MKREPDDSAAPSFRHTDETDAVIRAGYAINRRISEIAADLGISRNAVIGRANRLRLTDPNRLAEYLLGEENVGRLQSMRDHPGRLANLRAAVAAYWTPERRMAAGARLVAGRRGAKAKRAGAA